MKKGARSKMGPMRSKIGGKRTKMGPFWIVVFHENTSRLDQKEQNCFGHPNFMAQLRLYKIKPNLQV